MADATYDPNGNTLQALGPAGLAQYAWGDDNRLTGFQPPTGAAEAYQYRIDGLRWKKSVGGTETNYLWDGQNLLAEQDASRARQAWYTDSPGAWGGLVSQRRADESRTFGFDPFHNTRFLTGPDGEITDSYLYGAFGDEIASSGGTLNAFRYGGKYGYYRDGAERNYVRERYLNTDVGRWLSVDPVEGELPYVYAGNAPMSGIDPSGEQTLDDFVDTAARNFRTSAGAVAGFSASVLSEGARRFGKGMAGAAEAFFCFLGASPAEAQATVEQIGDQINSVTISFLARVMERARELMQLVGSHYQALRANLPPIVRNLLPEQIADAPGYFGGFIVGVIKTLVSNHPFALLFDILDLFKWAFREIATRGEGIRSALSDATELYRAVIGLFKSDSRIRAYDRGEIAGSVLATLVSLLAVIIAAIYTAGGALPLLATIGRNIRSIVRRIVASIKRAGHGLARVARPLVLAGSIRPDSIQNAIANGKRTLVKTLRGADSRIQSLRVHYIGVHHRFMLRPRNPNARPAGTPTVADRGEGIRIENDTAILLAQRGFDIYQNPASPDVPGDPDYHILTTSGYMYFDCYAPTTSNAYTIRDKIQEKVARQGQIVLNLERSAVDVEEVLTHLRRTPVIGLTDIILIRSGTISRLWPPGVESID